ncbi:hypothetical protein CR513_30985, partial [Mucuna pruriens]
MNDSGMNKDYELIDVGFRGFALLSNEVKIQVFGDILRKKNILLHRLDTIAFRRALHDSTYVKDTQERIWKDYKEILTQEKSLYGSKSLDRND